MSHITHVETNRGEDEIDNSGSVGLLRTLSLPKNHRKAFATAV